MNSIEIVGKIEELYFTGKTDVLGEAIEDEMIAEYEAIKGATEEELLCFEQRFQITLPEDFKELYQYKNGSGWIELFSPKEQVPFRLLSLQEMTQVKAKFQSQNCPMSQFPDIIPPEKIKNSLDRRVRRYLYNKSWFPFATMGNSLYLMLDYCPTVRGTRGQVICYVHDPDFIEYTARSVTSLLKLSLKNIEASVAGSAFWKK